MEPDKDKPLLNLFRLGTEALHGGDLERATQLLERAHQLDKNHVDAALNLGAAYVLAKNFSMALTVLEPLSEREPDNAMVWTNLGAARLGNPVLARDKDQRRAIAAFERAIDLDPVAPSVAYNLGLIYRDRQDIDMALHWFRRAVQSNPFDRDARRLIERLSQAREAAPSDENGES